MFRKNSQEIGSLMRDHWIVTARVANRVEKSSGQPFRPYATLTFSPAFELSCRYCRWTRESQSRVKKNSHEDATRPRSEPEFPGSAISPNSTSEEREKKRNLVVFRASRRNDVAVSAGVFSIRMTNATRGIVSRRQRNYSIKIRRGDDDDGGNER